MRLKEDSTVGVARLGREGSRLVKQLRRHNVIVTRKQRPVGVIIHYADYLRMRAVTERLEDLVLGHQANKRASRRSRKTVSLEEAERRVGVR